MLFLPGIYIDTYKQIKTGYNFLSGPATYNIGDFGVPLVSPQALMAEPEKAQGRIDEMDKAAKAEVHDIAKANAQAETDKRAAAGEMEEARKEMGAQNQTTGETAFDALNPTTMAIEAALIAAGGPAALLGIASAAVSTTGYAMHDRKPSGTSRTNDGAGDNDGKGEPVMTADEWVMGSRAKRMEDMAKMNTKPAVEEGYNRADVPTRQIDLQSVPNGSLSAAMTGATENGKGISHFRSFGEPKPSSSSSGGESAGKTRELDHDQMHETYARAANAQASLGAVSGMKVTRGINCEAARDYAEKMRRELGLKGNADESDLTREATNDPQYNEQLPQPPGMGMAA